MSEITWEIRNDNTAEVIRKKNIAVEIALEAVGLSCEGHAVKYISGEDGHPRRVDTGNLRNSINHKVSKGEECVYVGTNVEYALPVHEGAHGMEPNRYLRDAAFDHIDEYKKLVEDCLKNVN